MATREDTVKMIAVMQAYVDGSPVQSRLRSGSGRCEWQDDFPPGWKWCDFDYRVKPKPREWWLTCLPEGVAMCFYKETAVNKCCKGRFPIIHVREVLDEGDKP